MNRNLRVDPADAVPIWKQIEHGVRRLVASGALGPGDVVPSVRDLSKDLRVNPMTVSKAYQHLVDAGVLAVKRGEGTYVADAPPALARGERQRILKEAAGRYATVAVTIGAERAEALEEIDGAWTRLVKGAKGGAR